VIVSALFLLPGIPAKGTAQETRGQLFFMAS
jgi:hypothetical protein